MKNCAGRKNNKKISKKLLRKILIVFLVAVFFILNALYLGVTVSTDKTEYKQGEYIEVTIANNSWHKIYVNEMFIPYFDIEKFDNGKWIQITSRVCDGWCAPSGSLVLLPKETNENIWWEKSDGRYRAKIKASIFSEEFNLFAKTKFEKNIYSKEFIIK